MSLVFQKINEKKKLRGDYERQKSELSHLLDSLTEEDFPFSLPYRDARERSRICTCVCRWNKRNGGKRLSTEEGPVKDKSKHIIIILNDHDTDRKGTA